MKAERTTSVLYVRIEAGEHLRRIQRFCLEHELPFLVIPQGPHLVTEAEREAHSAKIKLGLCSAKQRGARLGRPSVSAEIQKQINTLHFVDGLGVRAIAKVLCIGAATVSRHIDRDQFATLHHRQTRKEQQCLRQGRKTLALARAFNKNSTPGVAQF